MSNIVQVPFHGDTLQAVEQDGQVWVVVKRICEPLGLDYEGQRQRLVKQPWAVTCKIQVTAADSKNYETFCLALDSVPMWLATIQPNKVSVQTREALVRYQRECRDVLARHFMPKEAIEPSTPEDLIVQQALALQAQRRRLDAMQKDLGTIQTSVQELQAAEAQRQTAEAQALEDLRSLPEPSVKVADKSLRATINECIRQYGITHGGGAAYTEAWQKVYRELKYRHSFDVDARFRNCKGRRTKVDIVDEAGLLPQLYAICIEVLVKPMKK